MSIRMMSCLVLVVSIPLDSVVWLRLRVVARAGSAPIAIWPSIFNNSLSNHHNNSNNNNNSNKYNQLFNNNNNNNNNVPLHFNRLNLPSSFQLNLCLMAHQCHSNRN
jgi:hypothetical protein